MIGQKSTARFAMHSLKELRAPAKLLGGLALKRGRSERARYAAEAKRYHVLLGISDVDTAIELCNPVLTITKLGRAHTPALAFAVPSIETAWWVLTHSASYLPNQAVLPPLSGGINP